MPSPEESKRKNLEADKDTISSETRPEKTGSKSGAGTEEYTVTMKFDGGIPPHLLRKLIPNNPRLYSAGVPAAGKPSDGGKAPDIINSSRRQGSAGFAPTAKVTIGGAKVPASSKKLYLHEVVEGIGMALVHSKQSLDSSSISIWKEVYQKNEFMKQLPMNMFNLSEVEVDLKFVTESVETKDNKAEKVAIITDLSKLGSSNIEAISTMRLKLNQRSLVPYNVDSEIVFKGE